MAEREYTMTPECSPKPMRIAVVIVNYRTPHLAVRCLNALISDRGFLPDLSVTVVDNASGDDSTAILSSIIAEPDYAGWVNFVDLPLNGGFGWGNNQAILEIMQKQLQPEAIFLINPDAIIERGALLALVRDMQLREDAGAIGSQLLDEDGSLSGSSFRFPTVAREFMRGLGLNAIGRLLGIAPVLVPYGIRGPVDWVTGASVLIRTQAFQDAGLFDTGFFLYFEEVELMHRFAKSGWKTYHCPESRVIHTAGASTGVVDGKAAQGRAPPPYVFRSRHRYFALTGGRMSAFCADIAWLVGSGLSLLLSFVATRKNATFASGECKAMIRNGIGAAPDDARPAIARIDDELGKMPSWLRA